jgi:hypothetical protein
MPKLVRPVDVIKCDRIVSYDHNGGVQVEEGRRQAGFDVV